jgi:hypothetical protein
MRRIVLYCATVLVLVVVSVAGYIKYVGNAGVSNIADLGESMRISGTATNEGLPALFRAAAWYDENGDIDPDGISNALSQLNAYLLANQSTDGFGDIGTVGGIIWKPRGPQNVGGRTRTLVVNFDNPDILWAGAASGGVWKSFNRGRSWTALNNQLSNFNISSMAIDPGNSKILYVGTGDGPFPPVSLPGHGVYKSTDGGLNWVNLPATVSWAQVNSIAVARNGVNTIVLAAVGESSEGSGNGGIWRSMNGGGTWNPDIATSNASFVGFDPNDSSKAVAATCDADDAKCKAYYTITAGASPTPIWIPSNLGNAATPSPSPSPYETNSAQNFIEFAFSPSGGGATTIYAQHSGAGHPTASPSVISKSTDGGQNFIIHGAGVPQNVNSYKSVLWVAPTPDANLVIGGGTGLFRSTDGGANFGASPIGGNTASPIDTHPHVDMMFAMNDPSSNKRVYVTTDGGIFRTEDISTATAQPSPAGGWSKLNQTYQTTQFYAAAGDGTSGIITGGTQDNGSLRLIANNSDAGLLWEADGGEAAVDGTVCFGQQFGVGLGNIFRTSNCGASPVPSPISIMGNTVTDFNDGVGLTQLIIDQNSTGHEGAFFGALSVWRTASGVKTGTPSWYSIKANPAVNGWRPQITAMDLAPSNSNYLWVGEWNRDGGVTPQLWRTTAALNDPEWVRKDNVTNNRLPERRINDIFIDPSGTNPDDIVYVAYGGFEDDNLWRTTDHGASWTNITGGITECDIPNQPLLGLPCAPIRAVTVQPGVPATIYVGTEIGIYVTRDSGAHWRPVTNGPSNVSIVELSFMNTSDQLLVGTYGRGIWTGRVNASTDAPNDFDGDGSSDLAVVRATATPACLTWHVRKTTDGYDSEAFGVPGDELAPADYDGDGKTDITVFRPAAEEWYTLQSTDNTIDTIELGDTGDIPVPADFDGDDIDDPAVYRPSTGYWYVLQSENGAMSAEWGSATDTPVAADFDGDGRADLGIFELKENGIWYLYFLTTHGSQQIQFGLVGDIPVAGDYDGDGKADIAIWRPDDDTEGNGCWYVLYSADDYVNYDTIPWGLSGDVPVPGDYDGDGRMDVALWRPSDGMWHILQSSNGYFTTLFGAEGDVPVGRKVSYGGERRGNSYDPVPPEARPQRKQAASVKLDQK